MSTQRYEECNKALAVMCAVDLRPTSIAEGAGFRHYSRALNSEYMVPTQKTVTKYLTLLYKETNDVLMAELMGKDVALTTDMWTSVGQKGYITVTAHHLTPEWEMKSNVLATKHTTDRHTGVNVANHLTEISSDYKISVTSITTDNASNMQSACTAGSFNRVSCFAHTLQLCVNDGIQQANVSRALAAGKRLVSHFSHSVVATQALIEQQRRINPDKKPVKLMQDVATRWNSSFIMTKRLLELRIPIYGVIMDDKVTKPSDRMDMDISDTMWRIMEDIVPVLEVLADATEILSKEEVPTCGSIYVLLPMLMGRLQVIPEDSSAIKQMKEKIISGMKSRFIVDKNGNPTSKEVRSRIKIIAIMEDVRALDDSSANNEATVKQETDNGAKKNILFDCLRGDVVDLCGDNLEPSTNEIELETYISERVTVEDPLVWWKYNASKFPCLSKIARKFLAIPATEVPSERAFSVAGLTVTKLRASLDPANVDMIIFLHKNYKIPVPQQVFVHAPNPPMHPPMDEDADPKSVNVKQEPVLPSM